MPSGRPLQRQQRAMYMRTLSRDQWRVQRHWRHVPACQPGDPMPRPRQVQRQQCSVYDDLPDNQRRLHHHGRSMYDSESSDELSGSRTMQRHGQQLHCGECWHHVSRDQRGVQQHRRCMHRCECGDKMPGRGWPLQHPDGDCLYYGECIDQVLESEHDVQRHRRRLHCRQRGDQVPGARGHVQHNRLSRARRTCPNVVTNGTCNITGAVCTDPSHTGQGNCPNVTRRRLARPAAR